MAIRTDATAVQAILGADYNGTSNLAAYITAGSSIVDDLVAAAETAPTSEKATLLETWLAAHAYTQMDPAYTAKSTNKSSGSFTGAFGMGLQNSRYGQMAITLDNTGYLAELAAGGGVQAVAGGFWGGLPRNEQRDYDQRN